MRHKSSKTLYNYWNNLRGKRTAPERSEIEPSDLRHVLGDTFILEVDHRLRTISFRLAGTRLCNAYGKELKGYGFLCMWNDEASMDIVKTVGSVYRDHKVAVFSYTGVSESGREMEYEMILLPLLSSKDNNIRTLGVATPKTCPFWIGTDRLITNKLNSARIIDPDNTNPLQAPGLVPYQSNLASLPPLTTNPKRVGHLVVHEGGLTSNGRSNRASDVISDMT